MAHAQDETPQVLLVVRERLRAGSEDAYNQNELRLAAACATFKCPHPYLALSSLSTPAEVWWLNAFASSQERDGLDEAYARNQPLMAVLVPLGKRKEELRDVPTTIRMTYRSDLGSGAGLRIAGARFLVVSTVADQRELSASVFQSSAGEWFDLAPAPTRAAADEVATRFGPRAMMLAVQPQWSFPAETWVQADPDFWRAKAIARP